MPPKKHASSRGTTAKKNSGKPRTGSAGASRSRKPSAKGRASRGKAVVVPPIIAAVACLFCLIITLAEYVDFGIPIPTWAEILGTEESPSAGIAEGELQVHYIDVGQGDSILIQGPKKNVLIDAGENGQGDTVLQYLKAQGINRLDIIIGTHPHSDHIGGMDDVIKGADVKMVIMPELAKSLVPTTKTYQDVLKAIQAKGLKITRAAVGDSYDLGGGATLQILGPVGEFNDLNSSSVVSRLDFGETSFLFTGDIEEEAERAILNRRGISVQADVYDAPHHGSSTSSSEAFLDAVNPAYAAMSVGEDNSYGHPHKETLEKFEERDITYYRTDIDGSYVFTTDGSTITIHTSK